MKKYGLNLRVQPSHQKKQQPTRPPLPPPMGFRDDEDDDVEREISRHASKNKALKDIEEQHQKALEEDPSVFDYDGVYDEMKEKAIRPLVQDRQERKSKYIQTLMEKAKERERVHEIVYERKLAKERSQDDHLYADKDKFVTAAYKKKLAEQAKWLEEERLRQLREDRDDVTKKSDMSEFYFNLQKNVAFGAKDAGLRKREKEEKPVVPVSKSPSDSPEEKDAHKNNDTSSRNIESLNTEPGVDTLVRKKSPVAETTVVEEEKKAEEALAEESKREHHKRNEDALAAAKERFLARKKAKVQAEF